MTGRLTAAMAQARPTSRLWPNRRKGEADRSCSFAETGPLGIVDLRGLRLRDLSRPWRQRGVVRIGRSANHALRIDFVTRKSRGHPPFAQDDNAIAHADEFGQFG